MSGSPGDDPPRAPARALRRFRIARHDTDPAPAGEPAGAPSHYDLWLERDDGLLTSFRLDRLPGAEPGAEPGEAIAATRIFDHRLVYLEREGELGPGRGRGRLTHVARGTYRVVSERDGFIEVELACADGDSSRFAGRFALERVSAEPALAEPWLWVRIGSDRSPA